MAKNSSPTSNSIPIIWGNCQVLQFREKFKMRTEDSVVHCDAVAIRAFVTLIFRRHDGHKRKVH